MAEIPKQTDAAQVQANNDNGNGSGTQQPAQQPMPQPVQVEPAQKPYSLGGAVSGAPDTSKLSLLQKLVGKSGNGTKAPTENTFTKLFGIESHTIKTGNSVASVRATAFGFREDYILGGYGEVSYQIDGREFLVLSKKVVEKVDGEIIERDATQEEVQRIIQGMERTLKELEYLREREIEKKPFLNK